MILLHLLKKHAHIATLLTYPVKHKNSRVRTDPICKLLSVHIIYLTIDDSFRGICLIYIAQMEIHYEKSLLVFLCNTSIYIRIE